MIDGYQSGGGTLVPHKSGEAKASFPVCLIPNYASATTNGMHNLHFVASPEMMTAESGAGNQLLIDLNGHALISEVQFRNQIRHCGAFVKSALVAIENNLHGSLMPPVG